MAAGEAVHIVLVLANLMAADGTLNRETKTRVDLGAKHFFEQSADRLMLIGWDYRRDSPIAICDAMAAYAVSECGVIEDALLLNRVSRDTVGDAILSKLQIERAFSDYRLTVVSSDYHVARVRRVFQRVYGPRDNLEVLGSVSAAPATKHATELESLATFERTFEGVPTGDLEAFRDRLLTAHPLYNGTRFPDRPVPAQALVIAGDSVD